MSKAQIVYDILDKIEIEPIGRSLVIIKGKKNLPAEFIDWGDRGYLANLDHKQTVLLSQLLSKQEFPNGKERYAVPYLQTSYDEINSSEKFKSLIEPYWMWNSHVILSDSIIADPIVVEREGELFYDGRKIKVKINTSNVLDILVEAGLMKKLEKEICSEKIGHENGESSITSNWDNDRGCLDVCADISSYRNVFGLVIFEKTTRKPDISEKVEIAKEEYKELLKDAEKYRKMKPNLNQFNLKIK